MTLTTSKRAARDPTASRSYRENFQKATVAPMRIIAGERKGARIYAPRGMDTRPTSDRVREAAFSLIGPVDGAAVLDLFAGSGAMGLEALSRGAASCVFVETDREALRAIDRNLEKLQFAGVAVVRLDALAALATDAAAGRRYDLVLLDPPYGKLSKLVPALSAYLPAVLSDAGLVVFESEASEEPELPLAQRTTRRYGSTRLTLFEHE